MKIQYLMAGVAGAVLASCSAGSTVVDLRVHAGPIAAANPDLVIKAVSTGKGNDGTISYALPDGVICNGGWQVTTNRGQQVKTKSGDVVSLPPQLALIGPGSGKVAKDGFVTPVGEGGRVTHGGTGSEGLGGGNCSNGATFVFAFVANGTQGRGALKDSNGNIFKVALR